MDFNPSKKVQTRSGLKVEVLADDVTMVDGNHIVGLVWEKGVARAVTWTKDGLYSSGMPTALDSREWDLINPVVQRTVFVNLLVTKGEPHTNSHLAIGGPYANFEASREASLKASTREVLVMGQPITWEDAE